MIIYSAADSPMCQSRISGPVGTHSSDEQENYRSQCEQDVEVLVERMGLCRGEHKRFPLHVASFIAPSQLPGRRTCAHVTVL